LTTTDEREAMGYNNNRSLKSEKIKRKGVTITKTLKNQNKKTAKKEVQISVNITDATVDNNGTRDFPHMQHATDTGTSIETRHKDVTVPSH